MSRPTKTILVLLIGTPKRVNAEDVATGFSARKLSVGQGEIVVRAGGAGCGGSICFRTSYQDVIKITKGRHVMVGWTSCRVRLLESDTPRCFKYWGEGHFLVACKETPRPSLCFQCKKPGNFARDSFAVVTV